MEVLFHFAFTLLKVSLQACIYATLLVVLALLYAGFRPGGRVARVSREPGRLWWVSGFALSVALVLFSFTYWGAHGYGDSARLPLGHGEAIEQMNGVMTYFTPVTDINQPELETFQVAGDVLCAKAPDSLYFTYDLATKRLQTFPDSAAYEAHARAVVLPSAAQFESFHQHYRRYWGGWRFWLLA